jgi:hypothetical protein
VGPGSAPESCSSPGRRGRPWLRVAAAERGCFLAGYVGLAADGLDLIAASRSRTTANLDNRTDIAVTDSHPHSRVRLRRGSQASALLAQDLRRDGP